MEHGVLLEKIVQNLSFEVKTIPNGRDVQITGPSGRTPVKVKVKVRKKDKADVNCGLISVPEKRLSGTITDNLRVVSSDQTITSFDMFLEAEQKLPMKKHRNKFLDLLRPGICLGNQSDDKDYYRPRNSQDSMGGITSKSDGVLKPHLPLSKKDYIDASTASSKRNPYFLGKCKPGGCLDPPFSEDKYSYIPSKKQSPIEPSTLARRSLYLADDIVTPKKLSDPKTTSSKQRFSQPDSPKNVEILSHEQLPGKSIQKLYQAESVNTSLSITYSNSIITYPPPLTPSEIRLNNEKNANRRGSTDSKTKRSYDLPQTYFMPPREIINQFDSYEPSQCKVFPKGENDSDQENYLLKGPTNNVLTEDIGDDIPGITTTTLYQLPQHIVSSNDDIKIEPVVDDSVIRNALEEYNSKHKDVESNIPRESIKEIIVEPTLLHSKQQHELKSCVETTNSGSFVRKSIETDFKPSVKSLLGETKLTVHKISSGLLVPKDNEILGKTIDILPLSLKENNFEKRASIETIFSKISTMNLQKSSDINGCRSSYSPLQQNDENSKSNKEVNDLQIEPMQRQSKLDSLFPDPTLQMLRSGVDSTIFNILEETKDLEKEPQREPPNIFNDIQGKPSNTVEPVTKIIYNANEDVVDTEASPITGQITLTYTEEEQPQMEHSSNKNTTGDDSEAVLKQKEKYSPSSSLKQENNIYSLLDDDQPKNMKTLAPDITEKIKLRDESSKPSADEIENKNGEDGISIRKNELNIEPLLHSNIDKPSGSDENFDKTTPPTSILFLPKQCDDRLRDQLTKVENLNQIAANRYETDNLKRKLSQIIPDFDEPFRDIKITADVQTIEDAHPLEQESDLSQQNIEIILKTLLDNGSSEHLDKLALGSEGSVQSKESFNEDDMLSLEIHIKDKLENIETKLKSTESVEKLKDSNLEETHKIYAQNLLDNKENLITDPLKKRMESELDSFLEVPEHQNSKEIFKDESNPLQVVIDNIEKPSNVNSDEIFKTKISSIILQGVDRKEEKEDMLDVPVLDNIIQLNASIDNTEELSRDSEFEMSKPTKKILLENELGKKDNTTARSNNLVKPLDLSNNANIQDIEHGPSLTQKISGERDKYGLRSRDDQQPKITEFVKPKLLEKEYKKFSPQVLNLNQEENALSLGDMTTVYDESDVKSFRTSTMYAVLSPDPKKLKGGIATLKSNTIIYTSSKTTLPQIKKDLVTVDLAFHSYINENNESVLRTFNSGKEPQRFPDDRIIIIKSDINLNNEINIPIDYDRNLIIQLKRSYGTDHDDQHHDIKDAVYTYTERPEEKNLRFKLASESDNSMPIMIQSVYEKELLPLQSAIKELKDEIDYLQRHNMLLKDNLLKRKTKPIRLTNVKRCVCLKRIH